MTTALGRDLSILDPARGAVPALVSFDQTELERALIAAAREVADLRFGCAVSAVSPDGVVTCEDGTEVRATWVLACDGARSTVRRAAGIAFGGSTFAQPWLVVDADVDEHPVDGVRFVADPARPAVTLPLAPGLHRWEFMLDGRAGVPDWEPLVARWVDPAAIRPRRIAVYTYHARVAERWRAGRVLLAGDAAHVMPPFAGQGLSAGLRDVDNLAWKLAAVLDGAPEALLDTYETERRPEVVRSSALARFMGAVLQTRRRRLASARDAAFEAVAATPLLGPWFAGGGLRPAPTLGRGAVVRGGLPARLRGRGRTPSAGSLVPAEWEELLPDGWAVVGPRPSPAWDALGVPFVEHDLPHAVVVRPDRYVFADRALDRAASHFAARWAHRR